MEFYGFNSYTTSHQTAKFYNLEPSSGSGGNFTKKRFKYAVPCAHINDLEKIF